MRVNEMSAAARCAGEVKAGNYSRRNALVRGAGLHLSNGQLASDCFPLHLNRYDDLYGFCIDRRGVSHRNALQLFGRSSFFVRHSLPHTFWFPNACAQTLQLQRSDCGRQRGFDSLRRSF